MTMKLSLCIVALLSLGLAGNAHAQKIRAADTGAVDLILAGTDNLEPVTVKKGDVLWVESFKPEHVKVLVDPVADRIRPNVSGVAAETPVIGVRIESGIAYCPAIQFDAPSSRVQCFQDLNDDGEFDGGYYTDQRGFDTQFLSGWLRGLSGLTPKIAYTSAGEDTVVPTGRLTVQYDRISRGVPQFWLYVEQERVDDRFSCDLTEEGHCYVLGRTFSFAENDDGTVTFTPQGPAQPSRFTFYSVSSYRK